MGQSNSAPTSANVISSPTEKIGWQYTGQKNTISLANAQARPQTINRHPNMKRELNRMNAAVASPAAASPAASPATGGSRRKRRNKRKTRRHKK
jgi:hypothetical protein